MNNTQQAAKEILLRHLGKGHEEIEVSFHPCDISLMVGAMTEYADQFLPAITSQEEDEGLNEWLVMFQGALSELVELKSVKEREGKTADYEERQPKAWYKAQQVLSLWSNKKPLRSTPTPDAVEALRELVCLKSIEGMKEYREDYESRKGKAWAAAKKVVGRYAGQNMAIVEAKSAGDLFELVDVEINPSIDGEYRVVFPDGNAGLFEYSVENDMWVNTYGGGDEWFLGEEAKYYRPITPASHAEGENEAVGFAEWAVINCTELPASKEIDNPPIWTYGRKDYTTLELYNLYLTC